MIRDHWRYDRDDDKVLEFADDSMVLGGMKLWLGIGEDVEVDELNVQTAFESLGYDTQVTIIEKYIEESGIADEFESWFEQRYPEDEDEYDDRDDVAYEIARDMGRY